MSEKNPWMLDEPVDDIPQGLQQFLLGAIAAFWVVRMVIEQDSLIRVVSIIWAAFAVGLMFWTRWLNRHYRVVIDEKGVRMGSRYALEWRQIRTAAVIQRGNLRWAIYNSRRHDRHFILLSMQESKKAIDKWTFRLEAAKPGRDMRIPYSDRRKEVLEHYLHMTLPVIRL